MGIYIDGFKMPEGGYRTIEIAYDADGRPMAIADGGDVFDVIPATDVRPVVRGKWVYDHWCEFKCSNCGTWSKSEPYRGRENFCPNCGADMRPELPKEE